MTDDLRVALAAAEAAAVVLTEEYRTAGVRSSADSKSERRNLVTSADRRAEEAVLAVLAKLRPDDPVLAEESAPDTAAAPRLWCVDPLDGTNNFAQGIPLFCVSVALLVDGVPEVGVVLAPVLGETHTAVRGGVTSCNGRRTAVSDTDELADAVLATGFPYDRENLPDDNTDNFRAVLMRCRGMRRTGSAALDLAWVAAGRLDAFWELHLNAWDVAAGALLVAAAGGRVTDLLGGDDWLLGGHVAATNSRLHTELLATLSRPSFA